MQTSNPQKYFIVDDIQQVVEIESSIGIGTDRIRITAPGSHAGQTYSREFVYSNEEGAKQEVANRHTRLSEALTRLDLVGCLSINKEPQRKAQGMSGAELKAQALADKENYKKWLKDLKAQWEEINHEKPDLRKLAKTLRNAHLIQTALENPLAVDFAAIMDHEAKIAARKEKIPEGPN